MFPLRLQSGSDVEINANGRIKHNASVQYLHGDDALLADIQGLSLNAGDVLYFDGTGHLSSKPSGDFATASSLSNYVATADLSSALDSNNVVRSSDISDVVRTADLSGYAQSADVASTYLSQASAVSDYQAKADMYSYLQSSDLVGYAQSADVASTYLTKVAADADFQSKADMSSYLQSADLAGYALSADVSTTYQAKADMAGYLETADLQGEIQALSGVTLTAPGISGEVLENSGALRHGCVTIGSHVNSPVTVYDLNINGSSSAWKVHAKSTLRGVNGSVCVVEKEAVFRLVGGACLPVDGTDTGSHRGASDNGAELQIAYSTTHAFIKVQSSASNDASGAKSVVEYDIVEC